MPNINNDPAFNRDFERCVETASLLGKAAACKADGRPAMTCLAIAVAIGALNVVGQLVMANVENESVSDDQRLFAALLTVGAVSDTGDGKTNCFAFDPSVILDALNAFEKYTGRKPDGFLVPEMVAAARMVEKAGDTGLAMLQAISEARRNGAPLN